MTTDLTYLAWTALLTAALWIPYIVTQVTTNGMLTPENYKDPTPRPVPAFGKRADRAHLNAVEVFAPFAALILIIHVSGQASAMTATWAAVFFWSRVAHAIVYWMGWPLVRTLVFTVGFVATIALFTIAVF